MIEPTFFAATAAILVAMAVVLVRLFLGPTLYDRVLALNSFGTKTVLIIGLLGFLTGRPDFLDIALLYALINFVGTIAVLKFFRYRALGDVARGEGIAREADMMGMETPRKTPETTK